MTPLGWTNADDTPHTTIAAGPAYIICSAEPLTPRARLCQQTQIVRDGLAFLPLAPTSTATVQACRTWAEDNAADLMLWLETTHGLAQYTLAFTAPMASPAGDTWLRTRAALVRGQAKSLDALKAAAHDLTQPLHAREWRLRRDRRGHALDALAPQLRNPEKALRAIEGAGAALKGWSLHVVGPLPAFGFAPESMLA